MNNTDKLSSIFAPYIRNYIKEKEAQCLDTKLHKSYLSEFDNYLVHISKENLLITSEDIKNWAENRTNDKPSTLYSRFRIIAKFCRYMCRLGHECYVPVNPKCSFDRAVSTVFTHEQILDIFDEGDNIISKTKCPKNMLMPVPALIRTLYSTGIRIGEALSIKNKDVDFQRKAIVINDTKNNKQRLAPINESLEKVLRQYISYRDKIPIHSITDPDSCLFVSTLGKPCGHISIYKYFIRILQVCGIHGGYGNNSATLHSIRYTSAIHALVKMTRAGKDLYCSLPLLSVFMGHKSIIGTEYYVRLTQEMYPEVLKLDMEATDQIFVYINQKLQQNYENGDN